MNQKPYRTNRSRDYYRYQRERAMERKYKIRVMQWGSQTAYRLVGSRPDVYGQLNKGKIHCGCGLCTEKSKVHGYKKQDLSKLHIMRLDIESLRDL